MTIVTLHTDSDGYIGMHRLLSWGGLYEDKIHNYVVIN